MSLASILVTDLIADIRTLSGLRNNQSFLDSDIRLMVLDAGQELYDDIEGSFQAYIITPFPFTIASGNVQALPSDFKRDNTLWLNPTSSAPMRVDPLGSYLERGNIPSTWCGDRRYFINGANIEIWPSSVGPGSYQLYYTPFFSTSGAGGTEALPVSMTPWALYLKVHASIAIRTSRQQDTSALEAKLAQLKQRVVASVKNRTQAPRQAPITRRRTVGFWGGGNW